jgi:hypothetical protein
MNERKRTKERMDTENWKNDTDRNKPKDSEKILSHCHPDKKYKYRICPKIFVCLENTNFWKHVYKENEFWHFLRSEKEALR